MTEDNHSLDRVTILLDTILLAYFSEVKIMFKWISIVLSLFV